MSGGARQAVQVAGLVLASGAVWWVVAFAAESLGLADFPVLAPLAAVIGFLTLAENWLAIKRP